MKQDIKYIIKKIIIGICITLGVFYLKPLIGLAETIEFKVTSDNYSGSPFTTNANRLSYADYVFTYTLDKSFLSIDDLDVNIKLYSRNLNPYDHYIIFRNENINAYFFYFLNGVSDYELYTDNGYYSHSGDNPTYFEFSFMLLTSEDDFPGGSMSKGVLNFKNDYKNFFAYTDWQYSSAGYIGLTDEFKVVDTNLDSLLIDGKPFVGIPSNYEKIDLTGYNAVLFYPKDYRKVRSCTNVDNVEDVPKQPGGIGGEDTNVCKYIFGFDGYFLHNFTSALIQLDDNNHVLNELYKSYDTLQYDFYSNPYINKNYGFIFYNRDNIYTSDDGYVELKSNKGYAVIYFDSNLYNYVLIKDINTYNGTSLNFIDDKGNEVNTSVSSDSVKQDDNVDGAIGDASNFFSDFKDNDHGLSSIITSPLDFINQLSNSSCAPLVLPIPYSNNQNITLPCMTSIYENNFGIIYSIYSSVIIGITGYWVCVRIYFLVKGFKDPEDDKIEVLEL